MSRPRAWAATPQPTRTRPDRGDRSRRWHTASVGRRVRSAGTELVLVDRWWRAANYLAVGQIYLMANPLLREPLLPEHVKPRLLGHFGTVPGLNLVHAHVNRAIMARDLDAVFVAGPGHGGPGPNACAWLEGTYSELSSHITRDAEGMAAFFRQFSFPGGVPSHCAPETPGSFHEGGELGYSLLHAFGAALDQPDLARRLRGRRRRGRDRSAGHELALRPLPRPGPRRRGAADPAPERLQDRQPDGARPHPRVGAPRASCAATATSRMSSPATTPPTSTRRWRRRWTAASTRSPTSRTAARRGRRPPGAARWPMIVLRTPEGLDLPADRRRPTGGGHLPRRTRCRCRRRARTTSTAACSRSGCAPTGPRSCSTTHGRPVHELLDARPRRRPADEREPGRQRRSRSRCDLRLPDWREHGVAVDAARRGQRTRRPGCSARGCARSLAVNPDNFRAFAPDELASNRLQDILEVTGPRLAARRSNRTTSGSTRRAGSSRCSPSTSARACSRATCSPAGTACSPATRRSSTSSTRCSTSTPSGWRRASRVPWRRPIAEPQLPAVVARLAPGPQRLHPPGPRLPRRGDEQEARDRARVPPARRQHAAVAPTTTASARGTTSTWSWRASSRRPTGCRWRRPRCTARAASASGTGPAPSSGTDDLPDVVLACAGDVPTLETLAAASILRERLPDLTVRVVNVVDLMRLLPESEHPHGLPDREFDTDLHRRPAGHLRLPRLPVAGPPAHLPAHTTTRSCTCAATRRRAPRPRRSTW